MEIFWPLHSDYITSVLCWCKKRKIWACTKNEATLQSKKRMCVWDTVSNSKKARRCEMHYWINADRFVFLNNYRLLAESMYAQLNQIIMHLHASTHFYYNVVQFLPNATLFCISLFAVLHNIARLCFTLTSGGLSEEQSNAVTLKQIKMNSVVWPSRVKHYLIWCETNKKTKCCIHACDRETHTQRYERAEEVIKKNCSHAKAQTSSIRRSGDVLHENVWVLFDLGLCLHWCCSDPQTHASLDTSNKASYCKIKY